VSENLRAVQIHCMFTWSFELCDVPRVPFILAWLLVLEAIGDEGLTRPCLQIVDLCFRRE
jgi:hypothetical protein